MDPQLQLNVLGPFELRRTDGERLAFPSKKAQALLAFLATERDRQPTREQLATLLWSRTGDERARHNLRQALSRLRQLCPDLIKTSADIVTLNKDACSID